MTGPELLEHAAGVVARRRHEYGEPAVLFEQLAQRWSLTLGINVSPEAAALLMIDLKFSRLVHDPRHADSLVDLIGYSIILHELVPHALPAEAPAEPQRSAGSAAAEVSLTLPQGGGG